MDGKYGPVVAFAFLIGAIALLFWFGASIPSEYTFSGAVDNNNQQLNRIEERLEILEEKIDSLGLKMYGIGGEER